MVELLHELLPLSFIYREKISETATKYDQVVVGANNWVMRDLLYTTKNEMRNMLSQRQYDDIHERVAGSLLYRMKDDHTISAPFGSGHDRINAITCGFLVKYLCQGSKSAAAAITAADDNKLTNLVKDILVANLRSFGIKADTAHHSHEGGTSKEGANGLKIVVRSSLKENKPVIDVEIHNGSVKLLEVLELIRDQNNSLEGLADISEHFDFSTGKLTH